MNPYLSRRNAHTIGKAGRASEKRLVKQMGGRQKPASGAMAGAKGDAEFPDFLMEMKSTTSASMSLKLDWLMKIAGEARDLGKAPALSVSFVDERGKSSPDREWVMVPRKVWEEHFKGD